MRVRHAVIAVVTIVMALAVVPGAAAAGPASADPRLRPAEVSASALVADALSRSAIVRDLADGLRGTDVVAYVRVGPCVEGERDSSIHFVGRSKYDRFMVIKINETLSPDRQIALVGHELQHAVDMAKASWITDSARMQQYFVVTGWKLGYPENGFETLSALHTERKIGQELATAVPVPAARSPRPR
jgi:hypothetical protein